MEMAISQTAAVQPQAQVVSQAQASKSTQGAGFQKTLVQQINSESTSSSGQAQAAPLVAPVNKAAVIEGEVGAVAPSLTDLMLIIDELLNKLDTLETDEADVTVEDEEQLQQLTDLLDQMNALLALLGLPLPVMSQVTSEEQLGESGFAITQLSNQSGVVKSKLQDTLVQMQIMLNQGSLKLIGQQEPSTMIAQQLQALTAILEGEPVDTTKSQTKSTAFAQQLFSAQAAPQADSGTMLQRLSQQTAHPAFLTTVAQAMGQSVDSDVVVSDFDVNQPVHLNTTHSETTRSLAPLVANATATTSFVVAEQFAQSMTGMIVQKFDLTTVNGISEAKIMLFPEHLGQVDVRITMQNGLLTAIFQTDTAMAKDMLDNQMAQLRSALQAQGLMVDKLEVSQGQSATQLSQQQQGQGSSQQQASNRQNFSHDEAANEGQFETEMVQQATIQGLGFGRGINVKA
ncbi:flagellar hook-length control protein FliK [Paenibacillus sinopodophylli]|uniref:flagellar hook-length control protein FliK n=1 Tax=Paenibacillus sinopodophylli TaxID=1837342 RepID=UPI00110D1E13|nr:flagellar hook-length control protein FliK [Paenibacillus sinopodophylli]